MPVLHFRPLLVALALVWSGAVAAGTAPESPVETLTLDEALARFRADSPTAEQLAGRVDEARATVRLASASALPIVAAQGGYTRNSDDAVVSLSDVFDQIQSQLPVQIDTSGLPGDLVIQPLEQWTAGASVTVPLLAPTAWADVGAARKMARAAESSVEAVRQQAEGGLVKAAWLSRAAEEVLAASEHAVEQATAHRDSARRKLAAGTGTELEVLQAETELTRRESERLQAVADLDKTRRALGALLGADGAVRVDVAEAGGAPPSADAAASQALAARPDLRAANEGALAARRSMGSAWWRHAPTLSGNAAVFASDVAYPTGEKDGWKLGLTATWVLYDGGARYGLLDRSRAQRAQAEAQVRQLELDADRQARDAVAALNVATERLKLAEQAVETATRAEASASRLYDAGLLSSLDAIDAQQRRLEVEVARAGAAAQLGAARADLAIAIGQGW